MYMLHTYCRRTLQCFWPRIESWPAWLTAGASEARLFVVNKFTRLSRSIGFRRWRISGHWTRPLIALKPWLQHALDTRGSQVKRKLETKAMTTSSQCNTGRTCLPLMQHAPVSHYHKRKHFRSSIHVVQKITIIRAQKIENSRFEIWYSVLAPADGV